MLDLFTIYEKFGSFDNLSVSIIGDIAHSRVARSNIYAMQTLGIKVKLFGPPQMMQYARVFGFDNLRYPKLHQTTCFSFLIYIMPILWIQNLFIFHIIFESEKKYYDTIEVFLKIITGDYR